MTTPKDDILKITVGLVRCLATTAAGMYREGAPHAEVTAELQELSGGHLSEFNRGEPRGWWVTFAPDGAR